jgi:nicotinate-nucleotide pyrophosphorylase
LTRRLREDIGDGDVTSNAIFTGGELSTARVVAKEDGVFLRRRGGTRSTGA